MNSGTITLKTLRRRALLGTFGPMLPLGRAFARMGFVQADPIRAPARAQDLILRHRVTGYRAGDLERRYARLGLEESYLHAYGFAMPWVQDLLLPRHDPEAPDGRHVPAGLAAEVFAFVAGNGPTHPGALADRFGREREVNGWGGMSQATTRALQRLLHHGHLRVSTRAGGVRVYEAAPARESGFTVEQRIERLTLLLARILAPVPVPSLNATMAPVIRSVIGPGARPPRLLDRLLAAGALESAAADGLRYVWPADLPASGQIGRTVRFLAPFDPLVWDRRRFEHLWGWPYRFEAYTPPAKRRLGYYAMPLLWGDAVIGWVNCAMRGGTLTVQPGFVTERPGTGAFTQAFDAEVARMEQFLSGRGTG
jgi:uncharacterized protein YcaQ